MERNFETGTTENADSFSHKAVMNKEYYEEIWKRFWDECLDNAKVELNELVIDPSMDLVIDTATEIFEESANAEQIAGYYIVYHKEDALKDWKTNTEGINFSEKDNEINKILEALYL